jgi:outer membrane protein OmpA-like peptidoglycan-associated protein
MEINHSIAAVAGTRALQRMQAAGKLPIGRNNALNAAISAYGSIDSPLETGAIGIPELPMDPGPTPAQDLKLQHNSANEPCRPAGQPFAPLPFTKGISVDDSMVPALDRLAGIASVCPGVRIEVHGYSDGKGSLSTNRANAQAGAQAVTDYLIAAGIAPNRIAAIGRGGLHSVLPYSKGDRQRRVEFVVRDPGMDAVARRVMWDLAELLDPTYVPAVAGLSP